VYADRPTDTHLAVPGVPAVREAGSGSTWLTRSQSDRHLRTSICARARPQGCHVSAKAQPASEDYPLPENRDRQPVDVHWPSGSYLGILSAHARQALLQAGFARSYLPGEQILTEGEHATHLFLIQDGLVKVTAVTVDGRVSLLAIRAIGDVVGELGALDGAPRSATVTAVTAVTARVIPQDEFVGLFRDDPQVALALVAAVGGKLRAATRARVDVGGYPLSVRLARALVALADSHGEATKDGVAIAVPLSQEDLASLVSSSPAGVARALRQLREEGIVNTSYRHLTIRDLAALSQLADG
jgi:CRP/FNR family transcriptional regulator, cyclic AMP receptor protein